MDVADRLDALFRGSRQGWGTYQKEIQRQGEAKLDIKTGGVKTVRGEFTKSLWIKHLEGTAPLGVIPIDENDQCCWGVIDIDVYEGLSHIDILKQAEEYSYPACVCFSKSGGAHVFIFTEAPVPAFMMYDALKRLSSVLGRAESEIFPKQLTVIEERGQLGNWLNMPYFKGDKTTRYCINNKGLGLSVKQFVEYAEQRKVPVDQLADLGELPPSPLSTDFKDGPRCLEHLATILVGEGGRNNALFNYVTFARRKFPDNWRQKVREWNLALCNPPIAQDELELLMNNHAKKEGWNYKCKDEPISRHCEQRICRTRKYGVGGGGDYAVISQVQVYTSDPPLFFVVLNNGNQVTCTSEQLLYYTKFRNVVLEAHYEMLPSMKEADWAAQVRTAMENKTEIEAPEDIGVEYEILTFLEMFLTSRASAETVEEIRFGRPWLNEKDNCYYFMLKDFQELLRRNKYEISTNKLSLELKKLGASYGRTRLIPNAESFPWWRIDENKFQKRQTPKPNITSIPI